MKKYTVKTVRCLDIGGGIDGATHYLLNGKNVATTYPDSAEQAMEYFTEEEVEEGRRAGRVEITKTEIDTYKNKQEYLKAGWFFEKEEA